MLLRIRFWFWGMICETPTMEKMTFLSSVVAMSCCLVVLIDGAKLRNYFHPKRGGQKKPFGRTTGSPQARDKEGVSPKGDLPAQGPGRLGGRRLCLPPRAGPTCSSARLVDLAEDGQHVIPDHLHGRDEETLVRRMDEAERRAEADHVDAGILLGRRASYTPGWRCAGAQSRRSSSMRDSRRSG